METLSGRLPLTASLALCDRLDELLLLHLRVALDAQVLGSLLELLLGVSVVIDASERLAPAFDGLVRRLLGARV
jgi:hypothetical protein